MCAGRVGVARGDVAAVGAAVIGRGAVRGVVVLVAGVALILGLAVVPFLIGVVVVPVLRGLWDRWDDGPRGARWRSAGRA
jgi:hypothetical protein